MGQHRVDTAYELGWSRLRNGDLLDRAEDHGYDLVVTTDQQLIHQQNLAGRHLGVLVLRSTSWPRIQARIDEVLEKIEAMHPGGYQEVGI